MKISIIIVTYKSLHLIKDCIDSIFKNNDIGDNLEVIIVDNDSPDKDSLIELVTSQFSNHPIKIIETGRNGGYGCGNNIGITNTNSEIVIVMNPDVRFIKPIFKNIIYEFEDSSLGMIGVEFIDGSNPFYFKPEYDSLFHSLFMHLYTKRRKYDATRMYMSGSLMAFNRKAFIDAGKYDENIFMYYEEPDITNRIIQTGKKVKWLKGTMVQHLAHGRRFNPKLTDIAHTSLEYYCKKYNINVKRQYKIQEATLKFKILAAKILRDKDRVELFSLTLKSIQDRRK